MKKFICLTFLFSFLQVVFAQIAPKRPDNSNFSWKILENAVVAFEQSDLSEALNLANKAKERRKAEIKWECYILDNALAPLAVRRAGDSFEDVLKVLVERDENDAVALFNKYINLYGEKFFSHSVKKMVSWIKEKDVYPEADYLIGKIYQLEGEYKLAYSFFEKARENSLYLDIPDFVYDILQSMAELSQVTGNEESFEQALVLILNKDENFKNITLKNAFLRIINSDKPENVDRFFMLFRTEKIVSVFALYNLGNIYEARGDDNNALSCSALATIEAFSHILDSLEERDTSYSYTTFSDFLEKCGMYEDIMSWTAKNRIWEIIFQFGERILKAKKVNFARQYFLEIAGHLPDNYWQKKADKILSEIN